MWRYSLKFSLRSLFRELARGMWARHFVYPHLEKNERTPGALRHFLQERGRALQLDDVGDGLRPRVLADDHGLISKKDIRAHFQRYVRPRRPGSFIRSRISTSGTSGSPLTLLQDLACIVREEAFIYRQLRWMGFTHGQRRAWIRGDVVCHPTKAGGVFWCRDWVGNVLMMSSYHISSGTIERYLEQLARFDPVVIHAYPSSIAALASWMLANGHAYGGTALKGVMTSSETLDPLVRENVRKAFGVTVFDWYGQAERVAAIGTCEQGNYHLLSDYGIPELLPDGDAYELVGTSLNNGAMRLRHYCTGDTVSLADEACACGRIFPVVSAISGRKEKVITLPDGRYLGRLDHVFKKARHVVEGQIIYCGQAVFILKVVPAPAFCREDGEQLLTGFLRLVPDVIVTLDVVDAIERGPNGKFAFILILDETAHAAVDAA